MSKIKIEIKNRWTDSVLFEYKKENNTLKDTIEQATKAGAYLAGANLAGAYLKGANLAGANLAGANLAGANLAGAYLKGANLTEADLRETNLEGADLRGAYIFIDDNEINEKDISEKFEQNANIKIKETHINKNIFPTKWNAFWNYGLIICDWEIKDKEDNKEIKEMPNRTLNTEDLTGHIIEQHNKINELVRAYNNLKKGEEK